MCFGHKTTEHQILKRLTHAFSRDDVKTSITPNSTLTIFFFLTFILVFPDDQWPLGLVLPLLVVLSEKQAPEGALHAPGPGAPGRRRLAPQTVHCHLRQRSTVQHLCPPLTPTSKLLHRLNPKKNTNEPLCWLGLGWAQRCDGHSEDASDQSRSLTKARPPSATTDTVNCSYIKFSSVLIHLIRTDKHSAVLILAVLSHNWNLSQRSLLKE